MQTELEDTIYDDGLTKTIPYLLQVNPFIQRLAETCYQLGWEAREKYEKELIELDLIRMDI